MALLHPAPPSPLPTGHHRRSTGELLRRPALPVSVQSRRRVRSHAQKGPGTGTPSGSESDNVVLKAAWYASEALGVAASFFRPPSPEGDAVAADDEAASSGSVSTLGRAQVAEAIKDDFARSYFVTGNLTLRAYEEECEFADPAGSFRGLQRFKRNCTNFGSLLEKSDMKLTKWEDLQDKSIGHWRFSCVMSFPWRPILSATGYTEYYFDAESGKVCRHVENWNVPKMALLRQIFRPSRWAWEKR
uniref:Uncharacterized protein n=1 Tax=Avena sativa TaxID=4498 RepID=A0ACD5UE07_AVESA